IESLKRTAGNASCRPFSISGAMERKREVHFDHPPGSLGDLVCPAFCGQYYSGSSLGLLHHNPRKHEGAEEQKRSDVPRRPGKVISVSDGDREDGGKHSRSDDHCHAANGADRTLKLALLGL